MCVTVFHTISGLMNENVSVLEILSVGKIEIPRVKSLFILMN